MKWHFDLATSIGGRAEQQDRAEMFAIPGKPGGRLAVLADGMGGQQHGALAAQAVIDTARCSLSEFNRGNPRESLTALCSAAHQAIRDIGERRGSNPASTCTALYLRGNEAYWIHVGDSRLYHFNDDSLLYRTNDHTLAALLRRNDDAGTAQTTRRRRDSRLYMCLGGNNELEPEFGATAIGMNDWFMLCSDGFWSQVQMDEAVSGVTNAAAGATTADDLVALAAQRGGAKADNVSLVVATPRRSPARWAWWRS